MFIFSFYISQLAIYAHVLLPFDKKLYLTFSISYHYFIFFMNQMCLRSALLVINYNNSKGYSLIIINNK